MLTILSPAKKLLNITEPYLNVTSTPVFHEKTMALIKLLKGMSLANLQQLMHLSNDLAALNYQRFQAFKDFSEASAQSYPAIFLFRGDVYQQLHVDEWHAETLDFAQAHLCILSGLYGLLRPLDLIQPYRLEMGTKLANACGADLYNFWQEAITEELNRRVAEHKNPVILNLASAEYFNVISSKYLKVPVITIHFKEARERQLKTIGILAKKARGAMADYINVNQIDDPEQLKSISVLDYRYCEKLSGPFQFCFIKNGGSDGALSLS